MAAATSTFPSAGGRGLALTPNHIARYVASLCGLVALVLFYQPWVNGSLALVGQASLSGAELARGEAAARVSRAVAAQSRQGATAGAPGTAGAAPAAGAGSGGLTLPTRVPTAAAGGSAGFGSSTGVTQPGAAAPAPTVAAPAPAAPAAQVGGAGGLSLPTRVPTAAAGAASGFGSSAGVVAQPTAAAAATAASAPGAAAPQPAPAAPAAADTIPSFPLNLVPLAALGIFAFSLVWERLSESRDRAFGRAWTLILSYGGALGLASILYKIASAPADNVLIGPGVGGVSSASPALWGAFLAFLASAIALTVAWLVPQPPPPDPYWRARRPEAAAA